MRVWLVPAVLLVFSSAESCGRGNGSSPAGPGSDWLLPDTGTASPIASPASAPCVLSVPDSAVAAGSDGRLVITIARGDGCRGDVTLAARNGPSELVVGTGLVPAASSSSTLSVSAMAGALPGRAHVDIVANDLSSGESSGTRVNVEITGASTPPLKGVVRVAGPFYAWGGIPDGERALIIAQIRLTVGAASAQVPAVIRIDASGKPDETFGDHGVARGTLPGGDFAFSWLAAVDDWRRIVVGGNVSGYLSGRSDQGFLERFTDDGQLDTSLGSDGVLWLPDGETITGWAAEPAGTIVLATSAARVLRLGPDGTLLEVARNLPVTGFVLVDADGGILLVGGAFRALRLRPDGSIDAAYGDGGVAELMACDGAETHVLRAVSLDGVGRLAIAAQCSDLPPDMVDVQLVRALRDGKPDATFYLPAFVVDLNSWFFPATGGVWIGSGNRKSFADDADQFDFAVTALHDDGSANESVVPHGTRILDTGWNDVGETMIGTSTGRIYEIGPSAVARGYDVETTIICVERCD